AWVSGLTGDDLRIDARIALVCARMALPVAAASRQQALAVSVLVCDRVLGGLDGRPPGLLSEASQAALEHVPDAARWAHGFTPDVPVAPKAFRERAAPFTVHTAAEGIAQACIPQPDEMLRDLLIAAIGECAAQTARDAGPDAGRGTTLAAAARWPEYIAVAP